MTHLASGAPFWPENPILTGQRLRYPFGVDLLTAVFVQLGASLPVLLVVMGLAGSALTALVLRRWGGALAVLGFVFSGGLAGFQVLWTGARRGLPVGRGVEEPLPRPVRAAAGLPPRAAGGSPPPVVVAPEAAARRDRPSALGGRPGLGRAASRPPAHVPLRFASRRGLGARCEARGGRVARAGVGLCPGGVVGLAGDRRLPGGVARGLEAGLGDRRAEPARLPARQLRPLPAPGARGPRGRGARAPARGAPGAGPEPRGLRGSLLRAPRAVGVGQHEGHALVLRGGARADRLARAGPCRAAVAGARSPWASSSRVR